MLGYKFHKNRTINEEFDFWGLKVLPRETGRPDSKIRKNLIQNVGPKHTENFSILAQLEGVQKSG